MSDKIKEIPTGRVISRGGKTAVYDEKGKLLGLSHIKAVQWIHGAGNAPSILMEIDLIQIDADGERLYSYNGKTIRKIIYEDGSEEVFLPILPTEE